MKRALYILLFLFVILCALGGYAVKTFKPQEKTASTVINPKKDDVVLSVVETGTIEAVKSVEVKGLVSGRVLKMLVDAGDTVKAGQLIAVIDPKETLLKVKQERASLASSESGIAKARVELDQRRVTSVAAYKQAVERLKQLESEDKAQPTLTNATITQAQTALASAKQERERLVTSSHPSQRASTLANVQEAQANYETAKLDYERQKELFAKEFTSQKTVEVAKQSVDVAKARLDTAKESLNRLDAQLAVELTKADESIRQNEAELSRAKANAIQDRVKRSEYLSQIAEVDRQRAGLQDVAALERGIQQSRASADQIRYGLEDSERTLAETEIRAPIAGIVTKRLVQEGEIVAGQSSFGSGTSIVKIEDRTKMKVKMDVNEIDAARMVQDMASDISIDALPELAIKGHITKIAPASSATTATSGSDPVVKYEVEVQLDQSDPGIRSGMSAKCAMITAQKKGVVTIPAEYLIKESGKTYVQLAAPKGSKPGAKGDRKSVTIGLENGSLVEVTSGLSTEEQIDRPAFGGPKRKGFIEAKGGDE